MGANELMAGFDMLISSLDSPESIKQDLLNAFNKKPEEACIYYDSLKLVGLSKQVSLLVGCYRKYGAVDWLLSIEHDLPRDERSIASEIAKSIGLNCYLPDNNSTSYEDFIEYGPENYAGKNVKLSENDNDYFKIL